MGKTLRILSIFDWTFLSTILLGLFFVQNCSSIQKLEDKTFYRQKLNPIPFQEEVPRELEDPLDHKIRKKNKMVPTSTLVFPNASWKDIVSNQEAVFFQREIISKIQKTGVHLVSFPSDLHSKFDRENISQEVKKFFQEKDIDAYLYIEPSKENPTRFRIQVIDSVNNHVYTELFPEWKMERISKPEQSILWNRNSHIQKLQSNPLNYPELVHFPTDEEWKSSLQKSIQGKIQILASSSDTKVSLDGKDLGEVPIKEHTAINGPHRIVFTKPGNDPIVKYINIRAGSDHSLIHEWKDDVTTSTLRVHSYPQGLEFWLNDEKKGKTHQYLSEIVPGDYRIQLTKEFQRDGGYSEEIIYAKSIVSLKSKESKSIALPYLMENSLHYNQSEFWIPIGRKGFQPNFNPNMSFSKSQSTLLPGEYGFLSSLIFPDRIGLQGQFPEKFETNKQITILFHTAKKNIVLEVRGNRIALFEFSNRQIKTKSIGVWEFKHDIKPEERIFRIETNPDKKELTVQLGNREIFTSLISFQSYFQIGIFTQGNYFWTGNPLKYLNITYPDMVELEKKREAK